MGFESGAQMGMQALDQGLQMAQRRNERADDQEYRRKRDQVGDARTAVRDRMDQDRLGMVRTEFEMKKKLADRDMEDYVVAKTGLDSFQKDYQAIPSDDPQRVAKVTALKLKHLPSIARNKSIATQFEAFDGAEKQTAAWMNDNILKDQLAATITEANRLNLGPEAMAIMKATQSGELSVMDGVSQLSSAMAASRKQQTDEATDREIRVRRAPYEARAERAPSRMGQVEHAQMQSDVRNLDAIRKELLSLRNVDAAANPAAAEKVRLLQGSALRLERKVNGYKTALPAPAGRMAPESPAEAMPGELQSDDPLGLFGN